MAGWNWGRTQAWAPKARIPQDGRVYFEETGSTIDIKGAAQAYKVLYRALQKNPEEAGAEDKAGKDVEPWERATRAAARATRGVLLWRCMQIAGPPDTSDKYLEVLDNAFDGELHKDSFIDIRSQVLNAYHREFGRVATAFQSRTSITGVRRGSGWTRKLSHMSFDL